MKYLFRLLLLIIWGCCVSFIFIITFTAGNLLLIMWYLDFKHLVLVSKEEIKHLFTYEGDDWETKFDKDGVAYSARKEFYYSSPLAFLLKRKTYKNK